MATASVVGEFNDYYFGMGPFGIYGSHSGLWDIHRGEIELNLALDPLLDMFLWRAADYTIVLRQFVDGMFYPGTVSFSMPGTVAVGRTVVEARTGAMIGSWVEDTYHWTGAVPNWEHLSLRISPAAQGSGLLLVDAVWLEVREVPEPASSQMLLAGLLVLGLRIPLRCRAK